ncbi:hypothetical protein [Corynebacterium ammoniagenes]|uniref:Uncharacterized protein n=1 Tax=Corynebacterium ammoniagenes TaxID=1697 RepID=A0AAV5GA62_CORAM|nr:hypothetical protein [Corynebacterium ammoniagenes]GJN43608.1 hypothetical protein CAT723_20870 [Corynebacterium ammoniagenes]
MIEHIINTLKSAFDGVVELVGNVLGEGGEDGTGVFGAIADLSSNVF